MAESIEELGTDIKSNWGLSYTGDLILVESTDNIVQAVTNRLNCPLDYLDLYYIDYGSVLQGYLGRPKEDDLLEFIRIEIENRLVNDLRLTDYTVQTEYTDTMEIKIDINLYFDTEEDINVSMILTDSGEVVLDGD